MVTLCWAAKGGSGTTVVTATLALSCRRHALLVDLDGDLPAALGLCEPDRPGVAEWLASDASPQQLADLVVDAGPGISLLPLRAEPHSNASAPTTPTTAPARWQALAGWLREQSSNGIDVFIDAGTGTPPSALLEAVDRRLLVTRSCYLALRHAVRSTVTPNGVVLVVEPGRALSRRDVEHALGAPVVATVSIDPAVARAVDAGLLSCRPPRILRRELRPAGAA